MTRKLKNRRRFVALALGILLISISTAFAQSTNLEFPTPVTSAEIRGRIRARDIGDSRLTSYYYIFEAGNGDVVLNIESSNLNGDIDVYTAGSLKPLLKASVYALGYATVMQRQVYLRIPARLILRVEGRTPNDEPADYQIKFSGVFKPIAASSTPRNPGDPKVTGSEATEGAVARVSSVGTILEEIKPPPPKEEPKKEAPKTTVAKNTAARDKPKNLPTTGTKPKTTDKVVTPATKETKPKPPAAETVAKTGKKPAKDATGGDLRETGAKTTEKSAARSKTTPPGANNTSAASKKPPANTTAKPTKTKPAVTVDSSKPAPDPLAGIFLVIRLKDDSYVRYEMSIVERVSVNNGVLTVVLKNGGILRRPLLEVAEVKIGQ